MLSVATPLKWRLNFNRYLSRTNKKLTKLKIFDVVKLVRKDYSVRKRNTKFICKCIAKRMLQVLLFTPQLDEIILFLYYYAKFYMVIHTYMKCKLL